MPRLNIPVISDADALALLDKRCSDWSIHNRDWPRHGFRYEVRVQRFFARGSGVGHTLGEAGQRALLDLNRDDAKFPRVTWDELKEAFPVSE